MHTIVGNLQIVIYARRFILLAALSLMANVVEANSQIAAVEQLPTLSGSALERAVSKGQTIRGRRILGSDLATLLMKLSPHGACDSHSALVLESSIVAGPIPMQSTLPSSALANSTNYDEEESGHTLERDVPTDFRRRVPLAISILDTTVTGDVQIVGLDFPCRMDLSKSRFEGRFQASQAAMSNFIADGTIFNSNADFQNVLWNESVSFHSAEFKHNAGFSNLNEHFKGGGTFKDVDFEDAVFHRYVGFRRIHFDGATNFNFVKFSGESSFSQASIARGPKRKFTGPFYMAEFVGRASFRNANFDKTMFYNTAFQGPVEFDDIRASNLEFMLTSFRGSVDFTRAKINTLTLQGSMSATEEVSFRYASIDSLIMRRMLFAKSVDFGGACLSGLVSLYKVAFKGDAHFDDARLPPLPTHDCAVVGKNPTLSFNEVTFEKGIYLTDKQFIWPNAWRAIWADAPSVIDPMPTLRDTDYAAGRSSPSERRQWREFERGFQNAGNLMLQNYALYRRFVIEGTDEEYGGWILDRADRWFWGYGLRPLRLVGWLGAVMLFFSAIYLSQTSNLEVGRPRAIRWWVRIRFVLEFSIRTMLQPKYGYSQSTTRLFKTITTAQWLISVGLLTCLLYAISKTNPLANELIKKFIP